MKKSTIWKSTFREIRQSFGRFMAILAIVALGVGFFSGLKVSKTAMVETAGQYLDERELYDYRLLSTLGFGKEDVEFFAAQEEVREAEGSVTRDILYQKEEGTGGVLRAHTLTEHVNLVKVVFGRLPEEPWECVVDSNLFGPESVGGTISLSPENTGEDLEAFSYGKYTIVGVVQSPYYIQFERGNSSLGSGRVNGFIYLPAEGFALDYYTEIFIKFQDDFVLYSDAYQEYLDGKEAEWEMLSDEAGVRRFQELQTDAEDELSDARKELAQKRADGETELADARKELEDAKKELCDAETELADGEKELADAKRDFADGERTLKEKKAELEKAKQDVADGEEKLTKGEAELADAIDQWNTQNKEVESGKDELEAAGKELEEKSGALDAAEAQIAAGEAALKENSQDLQRKRQESEEAFYGAEQELNAKENALEQAYGAGILSQEEYKTAAAAIAAGREALKQQQKEAQSQFEEAQDQIDSISEELKAGRDTITAGREEIAAYQKQLQEGMSRIEAGDDALAGAWMEIQTAQAQLADNRKVLEDAKAQVQDGERQLAEGERELEQGRQKILDAQAELSSGRKEYGEGLQEYEDGLQEYLEAKEEFDGKITDAEQKIADGERELKELEPPDTYVLGRDTNVGYVCFESDSSIVDGIANIFPVFFFLVAALVCSTTMNRMVEEQRTQIGVLKALGYGEGVIMSKYLFYAGTAALTGSILGFFGGTWVFPRVIWTAYGIMYKVESLIYVFDWRLAVISLAAALLCTMGTTWFSCRYELSQVAAQLMRPKAPKAGKRVFLELIPFVWSRLGFLKKVSVRNIFRYKKRLFMMVIGISGCTALLVTGFGVKDSIAHIAKQQFEEIQIYDIGVTLSEAATGAVQEELKAAAGGRAETFALLETSMDLLGTAGRKSVNVVVADGAGDITPYLDLHTEKKEPISYPGKSGAVITAKAAEELGIQTGESVTLQDENGNMISLQVCGISQNFIYNYVYINADTYEDQLGEKPVYKTVWVNVPKEADKHLVSASLMQMDGVSNVTVNEDIMERFTNMMASLDMIVAVIIVCAGGLAFIVLYNLTNINITERVREIATIKVLGFYKKETAAYVFRENTVLTVLGALAGLPLGYLLHRFVMNEVRIDMVAFDNLVKPVSYLYSIVLTMIFAWLVDLFMRRKLNRVSMTESLKSVE